MRNLDCSSAQKLMSSFIDSMATAAEAERLELHVAVCGPCQRQLQSYKSMRSLLARIEKPLVPEDMVLETRVRLSRERNRNFLVRFENRLHLLLKPVVVPALFGVSLTMLFFGILLGSLASDSTVLAQDRLADQPVFGLYKPVHTTDPTMWNFASSDTQDLDEPLTIETHVGDEGRVIDYAVLSGPQTPEVDGWIREMLSLAQFTPATAFGRPVESKIILSFVAVRN
jgi:Putative zinc-finger